MVTLLRPLSTSELLDRTFYLYRNNFLVFLGITAIPQLFILAVQLGGAVMMMGRQGARAMLLIGTGYVLFYLAIFISQAPTIVAVSNLNLEKPIGIGSSYSSAKRIRFRIFVVYFLMGLFAAVIGFMIQFLLILSLRFFRMRDVHTIQAAILGMQAIGIFVSTSLVGALGTIAWSLIYYDQRVRKEGFDLQLMMSTLESGVQNAAAAPAS